MRMAHPRIEQAVEWTEKVRVWELVVESPEFLRGILRDFSEHHAERDVNFLVGGKSLKFETEVEFIMNPFKLDFNSRQATTALMKILLKTSSDEGMYLETSQMKTKILQYVEHIIATSHLDFEVTTSDFLIDALAKAVNVHIVGDEDDFTQLLIDYMLMMRDLVGVKVFVFAHLRSVLSQAELEAFIGDVSGRQLNMLLIESTDKDPIFGSGRIVIDRDLCEI